MTLELENEIQRLRACICGIVEARDEQDFSGLMTAIDEAAAEATLSALRVSRQRGQQ